MSGGLNKSQVKEWFKISDWSRDYYFNMLKKNWSKSYN